MSTLDCPNQAIQCYAKSPLLKEYFPQYFGFRDLLSISDKNIKEVGPDVGGKGPTRRPEGVGIESRKSGSPHPSPVLTSISAQEHCFA